MYSSGRFGQSNDPWFRIGGFAVTTTAFVVGLGVIMMIVGAFEGDNGPIYRHLVLISKDASGFVSRRGEFIEFGSVLEGEIWRLITWPIPNEPHFWTIILFAVFYMLGSQIESLLGRWRFTWFLVALTVIPALLVTGVEAAAGITGGVAGLRMVEVGVLVAFAAQYSHARFWPGIPGWAIAVVIVGLDALQAIRVSDGFALILLACTVAVALLSIRAFGYAANLTWIPKLSLSSASGQSSGSSRPSRSRRRSRGGDHLRAIPSADEPVSPEIDALLDQVAGQGLDSLSRKQRKQLEAHARRLRRGR